jgi:hypothetical protein
LILHSSELWTPLDDYALIGEHSVTGGSFECAGGSVGYVARLGQPQNGHHLSS